MVELIVVMILAGVLGAIAVARFFDRNQFDAISFADQAAAAMRFAQKEAIAQNRNLADSTRPPVYVRFDGTSVSLCFGNTSPCQWPVIAPFKVSTDSTYCTSTSGYCIKTPGGASYSLSLGVASTAAPLWFYFDAVGRPYGASGALTSVTTLTITGGTQTATVSIEPETGYVH